VVAMLSNLTFARFAEREAGKFAELFMKGKGQKLKVNAGSE